MSRLPDVVVSTPLKFIHHTLAMIGGFFLLVSIVHFSVGNNGIFQLLIAGALLGIASKIKYTWVKKAEAAAYKRI